MPKRTDLSTILLIGSGPITIGQGCEFDYSGVQACKALRNEGYRVVLVNSNPASIMTDPEFADRTYIEPLTAPVLEQIIARERPDAILPTLGGQTALNLATELHENGTLQRFGVQLIGASAQAIARAEDRRQFKKAMQGIGLELPRSASAHTLEEARAAAREIGSWPLVIRPGFTLGGTGGGIARDPEEFETIVLSGLAASRNTEVLVEESLLGWKEFELEVIRDHTDTCVIVCSIENIDPMGVHTGDSITVAPAQTLSDRDYQLMRDNSIRVLRAIGVETGGANVQWAVNPADGRQIIIEMNPRVSRSSALASKATGFPIAKIATLLAIGYTLDELCNDITRTTPACFEPALDYIVVKAPRFAFEKFPGADDTLGTQMKSVGEAMSIARTFRQALQKALRSLETPPHATPFTHAGLTRPHPGRLTLILEAITRGYTLETLHTLTAIDPYFLNHLREIIQSQNHIALDPQAIHQAKQNGFSDRQIARRLNLTETEIRLYREHRGITPAYSRVDTCAGEFAAQTPYYYSSYGIAGEPPAIPLGSKSVMIIGGGPNRIGQGIEFDYCCVHAAFALREAGYRTVMVNSNPETVSTDYDTSHTLYFEPLTLEDLLPIYRRENCIGAIIQLGGQTPLNLAQQLKDAGCTILGTQPESIALAEDRDTFHTLAQNLGLQQPPGGTARTLEEAVETAARIGYPVLLRPSFVLGGRAMVIAYKEEYLRRFAADAFAAAQGNPVLIDSFLEHATEVDVDFISDGTQTRIAAIMEHIEPAGIHSGDSACSIPPRTLPPPILQTLRDQTHTLSKALRVCGLGNIQFAVKGHTVHILEVNPRAARTIPFASKATGIPFAKHAALAMLGHPLSLPPRPALPYTAFKEAVFPFAKFPGADIALSPEMKSTGEVMGIDTSPGAAYLKAQTAAGNAIPPTGGIFLSLRAADKSPALPLIRRLLAHGFTLTCTRGTATFLYDHGIPSRAAYRIHLGRPNLLDFITEGTIHWIINTPETGPQAMVDELRMRTAAVASAIPVTTTLSALSAALIALQAPPPALRSLQEYHEL